MQGYSLRPHHGLCIAFFVGKGYSPDFTENMTAVIRHLESENPMITLVTGADIICRSCPHCHNGICGSNEKVLEYDKSVLAFCGLNSADILHWKDFRKQVHDKIINAGYRRTICGNCQWDPLCRFCQPLEKSHL